MAGNGRENVKADSERCASWWTVFNILAPSRYTDASGRTGRCWCWQEASTPASIDAQATSSESESSRRGARHHQRQP